MNLPRKPAHKETHCQSLSLFANCTLFLSSSDWSVELRSVSWKLRIPHVGQISRWLRWLRLECWTSETRCYWLECCGDKQTSPSFFRVLRVVFPWDFDFNSPAREVSLTCCRRPFLRHWEDLVIHSLFLKVKSLYCGNDFRSIDSFVVLQTLKQRSISYSSFFQPNPYCCRLNLWLLTHTDHALFHEITAWCLLEFE